MTDTPNTPIVEARSISKRFGEIEALRSVSLTVRAGEVVCLLGDNGAGKSTLIKILSGVYPPSSGEFLVDGAVTRFSGPREAQAAGIATVHQGANTIPLLSVARNFFLGAELTKGRGPLRRLDHTNANKISLEVIHELGITRVRDSGQLVGTLSGGERQALAIGRAIYFGARVLILDEPTSALGVHEASIILHLIGEARARGVGVILITHNASHALSVGDYFTILIRGEVAADFAKGEKSREEILDLMAGGRELESLAEELATLDRELGSAGSEQ
jgi:simple sugar transport system ATP-binding protein